MAQLGPGGPWRGPGRTSLGPAPVVVDTQPRVSLVSPNSGRTSGGLSVTISGANFRNDSGGNPPVVLFGETPADNVVLVDASTITCDTPFVDDPALVDVSVVCGSQTGVGYGVFTYFESSIVSLTPAYGPIAGGTDVLIKGYNFVAGSTVAFGGNAATNITVIDAEHIKATTPNHAKGFVDVTVTEPTSAVATLRNGFKYNLLTRGEDFRRMPSVNIRAVLGNTANTATLMVDGDSVPPQVGEKIEITDPQDGDRLLFAGTVQSVEQVYEGQTDQLAWAVQCIDFTWLMNRRRPFISYDKVSASNVVEDLISRYAPGFTTNHVQTRLTKVSARFDGSKDLATCLNEIAQAIGGGHWYVDYNQDVHFFHVTPPESVLPESQMMLPSTDHITVTEGSLIPSTFRYAPGYLMLRHAFIYDDGSVSSFGACSDLLEVDGQHELSLSTIPVGTNPGSLTCVGRLIYYNLFQKQAVPIADSPIENIQGFLKIPDNVTTALTTWFGTTGASTTVEEIPSTLETPTKSFTGHPVAPEAAPSVRRINTIDAPDLFNGGAYQFKIAFLYRDGSVSFASPASATARQSMIKGTGIADFDLEGIATGEDLNGLDVIARFVYFAQGLSENPNYSISGSIPDGYVWPIAFLDPTWASPYVGGVWIVPDNTTTTIDNASTVTSDFYYLWIQMVKSLNAGTFVADWGPAIGGDDAAAIVTLGYVPIDYDSLAAIIGGSDLEALIADVGFGSNRLCGRGNLPYNNGNILSSDPIPIWPNNDGPSLEDADPPGDLTDDNPDLLHEDAGQPLRVSTDLSQVRNRVFVVGSGSVVSQTGAVRDTLLYVADISSFSPSGGRVRVTDPGKNSVAFYDYSGLAGVPGEAALQLAQGLETAVAQGAEVVNFYQADNLDSQKYLSQIELDKDGLPTDGVHEYTVVDQSLKAAFQLYMRAQAELEQFAFPVVTVRYSTRDPNSLPGRMVHVDMTNPPIYGDFLIQDVNIDQIHDESDALLPRYTVTATSVKFELTDLLLKILEQQVGASSAGLVQAAVNDVVVPEPTPADALETLAISFTAAQLNQASSSPIELIPAPGINKIIVPVAITIRFRVTSAFSSSPVFNFRYAGLATPEIFADASPNIGAAGYKFLARTAIDFTRISGSTDDFTNVPFQLVLASDTTGGVITGMTGYISYYTLTYE